jgi:hypothetical protein
MAKIFNGTPHPINIVANAVFQVDIRKYVVPDGIEPQIAASIPSNGVLSAKVDTVDGGNIDGIPVFTKNIAGCDTLPDGYDIYIVSQLYVSAARACGIDTSKLYTVADPVYTSDGRTILGSRGICPAF